MYRCHCGAEFNAVQQYSGHISGRSRAGESEHYAEPVPGRQVLRCPECSRAFYEKSALKRHTEKLHLKTSSKDVRVHPAGPEVSRETPQIDLATALLDRFEDILLRNRDLTTENANLWAESQRLKVELDKMQSAYQGLRGVRDRAEELLAKANR